MNGFVFRWHVPSVSRAVCGCHLCYAITNRIHLRHLRRLEIVWVTYDDDPDTLHRLNGRVEAGHPDSRCDCQQCRFARWSLHVDEVGQECQCGECCTFREYFRQLQ